MGTEIGIGDRKLPIYKLRSPHDEAEVRSLKAES